MKNTLIYLLILSVIATNSCRSIKEDSIETADFSGQLTSDEITGGILTPEILWKFGRLGEFTLSPDKSMIAYTVTRYDAKTNQSVSDIYVIPSTGGEAMKLTPTDGSYYNVRWTPDGRRIAYIGVHKGESQIFEMNTDGTGKMHVSEIEGGINGFEFSPDGSRLFFLKRVKVDETSADIHPDLPLATARISDDLMYRHWNRWDDGTRSHIFIANCHEGKISDGKDIMEDEPWDSPLAPYFDQSEIVWSNDGRYIAYTCKKMKGKEYALSTNSDIYIYDTEAGTTENLTRGMQGYDRYPVFSPESSRIAWQSMKTPGFESDKDRIFILDMITGKMEYITENIDQDASHLRWSDDSKTMYFISGVNATYQIYNVDLKTRKFNPVTRGMHNYNSFEAGDSFLIANKMSMSMAPELFRIDISTGEETRLTFINDEIYRNIKLGKVEERWVKTTDNKQMLVWVIYPPNFDPEKKYPALLYCQGGPQSAVSQFFSYRWNFQIMAAHDYIIVAPNRRGLPTFGKEWNDQISGDYGGQNIKDYLSAIDALSKETFVDENRLGAVGASYGGFSVFYLAGHHQGRFKAFISHCGIFNFESMYASTEEMFFVNHDYEGAFWEKPRPVSYGFSPHRYVDKWDTPILIITGEKDYRVPYTESIQAFNIARLRDIPARLLVFPDETHFVQKPQNSILWQREFFKWLDTWLK